jgi:hypothetical protein
MNGSYVGPNPTFQNVINAIGVSAIFLGYLNWLNSICMHGPHFENLRVCPCRGPVSLTGKNTSANSAFFTAILHVVLARASKKMFRIDASPVVAFVKHEQSIRNIAEMYLPRKSMRSVQIKNPITTNSLTANPIPARRSFIYQRPKSFFRWLLGAFSITSPTAIFCEIWPVPVTLVRGKYALTA